MSTTVDSATEVRPFHVDVPEERLAELRRRIAVTQWPAPETVDDASQGVQSRVMEALTQYWANEYDWCKVEAELNALPQFTTEIDGLDIHFIHVKSPHADALPMLLTHGWPGSVIEMLGVIGPLTDPVAHRGSADEAFDVVIPSIPGFGFSGKPTERGWDQNRIAAAWAELMRRLGYTHYVAQGGDQGATITDAMARQAPDGLAAIHLNFLSSFPNEVAAAVFGAGAVHGLFKRVAVAALSAHAERKEPGALAGVEAIFKRGYIAEMPEHPQTIGFALTDSPVALAAWILDHDADSYRKIARAFLDDEPSGGLTRDRVLDNITLYWLTGTGATASRIYWEEGQGIAAALDSGEKPAKLTLPVAFTVFPDELFQAPRAWADKVYPNLIYFNEVDKGGHFAAWEEPELFASEMRKAFTSLR